MTEISQAARFDPNRNGHRELPADARCRLLLEISHSIRGTLDLRETLDRLLDGLQSILPYDAAGIFVLGDEVGQPRARSSPNRIAEVAWRGFAPRPPSADPMLREGKGLVGHVIRSGEVVCASDARLDPRYIVGRKSTISEVAVPIQLDGRTIGALNLESDRPAAFHEHDVEVLRFFAEATAIAVEKAMLHERLVEAGKLERQLRTAQQVQERLLPDISPRVPGHELVGVCMPCERVGGDYFDYVPLSSGQLGLVVGDVSGHDIPAALIMSAFRALVRNHLRSGSALDEIAGVLNRELADTTRGTAFITAVLAVLDPASGRLRYVNCGHHPPLLDCRDADPRWLDQGGPLLGILDDVQFEIGEIRLAPGDQVALFTDGIVESRNPAGVCFGAERVAHLVVRNRTLAPQDLIDLIVLDARGFAGVEDFEDDVTLVLLRRESESES